jgi:DnaK suppressor protein
MTKIELSAFRSLLESRQADLRDGSMRSEALAIETSPDELDRIQHASGRDLLIDNLERDSTQLAEVRSALRRVNAGTFGFCVGCEEKINPKRLAAVPWASFCIV